MNNVLLISIVLAVPFLGTVLGAGMVFLLKKDIKISLKKMLAGFAAGVMIAASIWSLILPSMDLAEKQNLISWVPAAVGFLLGISFLLLLDTLIPHLHTRKSKPEGLKSKLKNTTMLVLAVTLHNIPEGMATGIVLAGVLNQNTGITIAGALVLAVGIAIQNFPEGAIISMPLKAEGNKKLKSFGYGVLSGVVEPIAALITIGLTNVVLPFLPYLLSFAAGAMMYVVSEELIPSAQEGKHSNIGTIGLAVGFVLMMVLDIALG